MWVREGDGSLPLSLREENWKQLKQLLSSPLLTTIPGSLRFLRLNLKLLPVLPGFLLFQFVVKGSRKKLQPCSLNEPDVTRLML